MLKQSANLNLNQSKDNTIFIGYGNEHYPIYVDMEQNPHLLITGANRTGKSRLMQQIISNIIDKNNSEIYLIELYKNDLSIFNECKQVKYNVKTVQKCNTILDYVITNLKNREEIVLELIKKGLGDSISDYNKINPNNKVPYIYICIDEYAVLLENDSDTKENRDSKKDIIRKINYLLQIGRSLGCFLILNSITLQDLFNNKFALAMISNKIVFRIDSSIHSRMLLDTSDAKELKQRECILLSGGNKDKIWIDDINIKDILEKINKYREANHKFIESSEIIKVLYTDKLNKKK